MWSSVCSDPQTAERKRGATEGEAITVRPAKIKRRRRRHRGRTVASGLFPPRIASLADRLLNGEKSMSDLCTSIDTSIITNYILYAFVSLAVSITNTRATSSRKINYPDELVRQYDHILLY